MSSEVAEPVAKGGVTTAAGDGSREPRLSTFAALSVPAFRLLWFNTIISSCIVGILRFAFVWLVINDLNKGASAAGLVTFALGIPVFFLVLPAGVMSDRMSKRMLLLTSQGFACVMIVISATLITLDIISVPIAIVLAILVGGTQAFGQPVQQAILPALIDRSRLMNAVVLTTMGTNITMIVGPALGGAAIALGGVEGAFIAMAALYFSGFLVVLPLKIPDLIKQGPSRAPLQELKDGLSFLHKDRALFWIVVVQMVSSFFMLGPVFTLIPQHAKEDLGAGAFAASALFAFIGVGMLSMSLFLASRGDMKKKGLWFARAMAFHGFVVASMGLAPSYAAAAVAITLWGVTGGIVVNMSRTLLQANTPPHLMGRVMSIFAISLLGVQPLGSLAAGIAADAVGISTVLVIFGAIMVVFGIFTLLTKPELKAMD